MTMCCQNESENDQIPNGNVYAAFSSWIKRLKLKRIEYDK